MLLSTPLMAAVALLTSSATAQRMAFALCESCTPNPTGGFPFCKNAMYQWTGDGDGDCGARTTPMGKDGCTATGAIGTPDGDGEFEAIEGCAEKPPVGTLKGGIAGGSLGDGTFFGYNCLATEGTYNNFCGVNFACSRVMECVKA